MPPTAPIRPDDARYDELAAGFNLAIPHRPAHIVEATSTEDVVDAVRLAADHDLPVAVMNTGHGPSRTADGAVLIRVGPLDRVTVDPAERTAVLEGGASWGDVLAATTPHGLAPLNGSSPHVGAVGYTLGGGVGHLGRRFGFAADHVRWLDVVTADGEHRRVDPGADADLFWAMRGAGANFGIVTAMAIDLVPVATLYGGELGFTADASDDVLHTYVDWAAAVPETVASSILLLRYPDDPAVPDDLRGRHITHLRVASSGDPADGPALVEPFRRLGGCVVDTVRTMPYAEVGTIHHEPVDVPVPAFDRNVLLARVDHDAATTVAEHAGASGDAAYLVELRAWGGALSRPPAVANAVGGRDAAFSLVAISDPDPANRAQRDRFLDAMAPWGTGTSCLNFAGVEDAAPGRVDRLYAPDTLARLRALKARHDPANRFRVNFNLADRAPTDGTGTSASTSTSTSTSTTS